MTTETEDPLIRNVPLVCECAACARAHVLQGPPEKVSDD